MPGSRRHTFPASVLPRDIGEKILRLRQSRGWSQAKLSIESGVPRETIVRIEKGTRQPLADTVLGLLAVLLIEQDDVELNDVVPAWPEADAGQIVGHGPRSRARRRQLNLSAAVVAVDAGVSEATLTRFERNAGPTPLILKEVRTPHGDIDGVLTNSALACALGFADLDDHEAFCAANDWREWPIAGRDSVPR